MNDIDLESVVLGEGITPEVYAEVMARDGGCVIERDLEFLCDGLDMSKIKRPDLSNPMEAKLDAAHGYPRRTSMPERDLPWNIHAVSHGWHMIAHQDASIGAKIDAYLKHLSTQRMPSNLQAVKDAGKVQRIREKDNAAIKARKPKSERATVGGQPRKKKEPKYWGVLGKPVDHDGTSKRVKKGESKLAQSRKLTAARYKSTLKK